MTLSPAIKIKTKNQVEPLLTNFCFILFFYMSHMLVFERSVHYVMCCVVQSVISWLTVVADKISGKVFFRVNCHAIIFASERCIVAPEKELHKKRF
jgi:hypothetical protein